MIMMILMMIIIIVIIIALMITMTEIILIIAAVIINSPFQQDDFSAEMVLYTGVNNYTDTKEVLGLLRKVSWCAKGGHIQDRICLGQQLDFTLRKAL